MLFGYSELVCLCLLQASGEAQYTTDIPVLPGELTAAFALTNMVYTSYSSHSLLTYHSLMQSNAKITAIHTDAAMVITTHLLSTPFTLLFTPFFSSSRLYQVQ